MELLVSQVKRKPQVAMFTGLAEVGKCRIHGFAYPRFDELWQNSPFTELMLALLWGYPVDRFDFKESDRHNPLVLRPLTKNAIALPKENPTIRTSKSKG